MRSSGAVPSAGNPPAASCRADESSKVAARGPKLLYFVTEDWYFCSHRLPLAVAARQAGYDVGVITRVRSHGAIIEAAGLRLIPLELDRGGRNPLTEGLAIARLVRILRRERPDLLHNVALKPVLYGTIAARLAGVPRWVNALAGLGHIFVDEARAGVLRLVVQGAFRRLLDAGTARVIVQNPDDRARLAGLGVLDPARAVLIRGSGVDLREFRPSPETAGPPLVLLAARMLWDKGVAEFVAAASRLRAEGCRARFVLAGDADAENHAAIPAEQLHTWQKEGVVEWWGKKSDMAAVIGACHIACLPSYYGEGVPKFLLEAAAAGKAIVTTDMPGCREVVHDRDNGLLVPPRDVSALVSALRLLIEDGQLRRRMGQRGREIAEREFSVERVVQETLAVYRSLLAA